MPFQMCIYISIYGVYTEHVMRTSDTHTHTHRRGLQDILMIIAAYIVAIAL